MREQWRSSANHHIRRLPEGRLEVTVNREY